MSPKSLPKELNTGAISTGLALDSVALPGRIYAGVKAGKAWAEQQSAEGSLPGGRATMEGTGGLRFDNAFHDLSQQIRDQTAGAC